MLKGSIFHKELVGLKDLVGQYHFAEALKVVGKLEKRLLNGSPNDEGGFK
jgi:hypothetical protein